MKVAVPCFLAVSLLLASSPRPSWAQEPEGADDEERQYGLPDWSLDYGIQPGGVIRVVVWPGDTIIVP